MGVPVLAGRNDDPFQFGRPLQPEPRLARCRWCGPPVHSTCWDVAAQCLGAVRIHGNVWEWCADAYRFDAYKHSLKTERRSTKELATSSAAAIGAPCHKRVRASNRDFTRAIVAIWAMVYEW